MEYTISYGRYYHSYLGMFDIILMDNFLDPEFIFLSIVSEAF